MTWMYCYSILQVGTLTCPTAHCLDLTEQGCKYKPDELKGLRVCLANALCCWGKSRIPFCSSVGITGTPVTEPCSLCCCICLTADSVSARGDELDAQFLAAQTRGDTAGAPRPAWGTTRKRSSFFLNEPHPFFAKSKSGK